MDSHGITWSELGKMLPPPINNIEIDEAWLKAVADIKGLSLQPIYRSRRKKL